MTRRSSHHRRDGGPPDVGTHNDCPTGKVAFTTRKLAKRYGNRGRMTAEHMRAYLCESCDRWHVGHLPEDVHRGLRSADEHYQRGLR